VPKFNWFTRIQGKSITLSMNHKDKQVKAMKIILAKAKIDNVVK